MNESAKTGTALGAGDPVGLKRMKRIATGLFVVVSIGFVVSRYFEKDHHWMGYVRATFEAAMVGAIADWFAVTALFRHPLGIPIPHTAIIAKRKDEIGRGLGVFVQENFLTPAVLGAKVKSIEPTQRALRWVLTPGNDERLAAGLARGLETGIDRLDDKEIETFLTTQLRERINTVSPAPAAARVIRVLADEGRKESSLDFLLDNGVRLLRANRSSIAQQFVSQSPWWVPGSVDARVFDRLYEGATTTLETMRADKFHPLRKSVLRAFDGFVDSLENDAQFAKRGEELKRQFLEHPKTAEMVSNVWASGKQQLREQLRTPTSSLRVRMRDALHDQAIQLNNDPTRQREIDTKIESAVSSIVTRHGNEVANLITSTVERWDTADTVSRIEGNIGRDLQFIRINGTVVGGLAGLCLYVFSRVL
jgi:uncharacterized membrane-anchored protein YjiN (DUF445 family)